MENIIFNELIARDFDVDVGVVAYQHLDENHKKARIELEIDLSLTRAVKDIIFNQHYQSLRK